MKIVPIPENKGYGFSSLQEMIELENCGYNYIKTGIYFNYYFSLQNYKWPLEIKFPKLIVDGFSPNLNKKLHIGHIRNLATAVSLKNILQDSKFVAMLGTNLGEMEGSRAELQEWFDFLNYHPEVYQDCDLPSHSKKLENGIGDQEGCLVWENHLGEKVITQKSDGKKTYIDHDLCFLEHVSPDYYIVGSEQKDHFKSLGLESKHLELGLIHDKYGKKVKSRTGNALTIPEAFDNCYKMFKETEYPKHLAWNVLAWNMLKNKRNKSVQWNLEEWFNPYSPGLYITYTYAHIYSIFEKNKYDGDSNFIEESHIPLLSYANYLNYFWQKSIDLLDPSPIAHYALDLSKKINQIYSEQKIGGGNKGY